jgi:predicted Ser/Thr protein kinase
MRKKHNHRSNYLEHNIRKLKFIGEGHEGRVYLLPDEKVLKVFHNSDSCKRQIEILIKARNSRFFPTVFYFDNHSIVMNFIHGSTLSHYLRHNDINKNISLELVRLIDEFRNLGFTRLDMRLGHIFLQPDGTIKIIDPRKSFEKIRTYPRSMLKGLRKRKCLDNFFNFINEDYPNYYNDWKEKSLKDYG